MLYNNCREKDPSNSLYLLDVFFFQVLLTVILFLPQVQELLLLLFFELSQFLSTLLVQSCQLLLEKRGARLWTGGQESEEQSSNLKSILLSSIHHKHFCTKGMLSRECGPTFSYHLVLQISAAQLFCGGNRAGIRCIWLYAP